jgi:transposase-like protein
MKCPYCKRDDMTNLFAIIAQGVREWICNRCGLTWIVEDEQ